jgi:2',3'-cyclic-nucleotide 2'-phosphodiesterase (5'-nucleotidase family)
MKPLSTLLFITVLLLSCHPLFGQESSATRELSVLYTNDEHGWMEGMSPGQGAPNLYRLWQEQEGFSEDGPFLVLSGGDNWTGPAISTWVEGKSMVEVMNAMSYDASAVGNHEFDFGLQALAERTGEAAFPYLSANTRWKSDGRVPEDLGILPYTIVEKYGMSIGIIGLTTTSVPYVTTPTYVRDLDFIDYGEAVRQVMPALAGTDLQFIIAHVCMEEMENLVREISDLGIDLAGGGHCNELSARKIGDTIVLGGGYHFTSYATATFLYDPTQDRYVGTLYGTHQNRGADADSTIGDIVAAGGEESADILRETVVWNATRLEQGEVLDQLIIGSWLAAFPEADFAITNRGGIRTALPNGEVTVSDIVNIMPFDNTIIRVEVTGSAIVEALREGSRPVVAGLIERNGSWVLARSGRPLDPDARYTLLVNSFMYAGGNNYEAIAGENPDGFDTGMNYRQPFVDWLKAQGTTSRNPLRL